MEGFFNSLWEASWISKPLVTWDPGWFLGPGFFSHYKSMAVSFLHDFLVRSQVTRLVVSNIFYFHPYLGKIPILTNIFQTGWNHHLDIISISRIFVPESETILRAELPSTKISWLSHGSTSVFFDWCVCVYFCWANYFHDQTALISFEHWRWWILCI